MKKKNYKLSRLYIFLIAFIEGAVLLSTEICSAKFIEAQIGISIYVWSSILSITLTGLAMGYLIGGYFSKKDNPENYLFIYLMLAGVLIFIMPYSSYSSLRVFMGLSSIWASILSATIFLLPPIVLLGCIGPTLIQLSVNDKNAGQIAGQILCVSTFSGVTSVLFSFLFLIPNVGLTYTCAISGISLILVGLFIKFPLKRKIKITSFLFALALVFMNFSHVSSKDQVEHIYKSNPLFYGSEIIDSKLLFDKTGLYGTVRVVDYNVKFKGMTGEIRALLVNNSIQTLIFLSSMKSMLVYVDLMEGLFNAFPTHNKVLHIGLGGGIVSSYLAKQNRDVTTVEIDNLVVSAAKKYFQLSKDVKIILNDGRQYLNTSKNKFDLLVINAFNCGIPPWNLFTLESFEKCHDLSDDNGVLVVELGGILKGDSDPILSSICQTIQKAGWNILLFKTSMTGNADYICLGHKKNKLDVSSWSTMLEGHEQLLSKYKVNLSTLKYDDAITFTDDNPILLNWASDRMD